MTLDFKKVIRESFERETHNCESASLSTGTKLNVECGNECHGEKRDELSLSQHKNDEVSNKETVCNAKSHPVSSNKSYKRISVLRGNLNNNSCHRTVSSYHNAQVPEWNKIFKNILGNDTAMYNTSLPHKNLLPLEKDISSQQMYKSVIKSRCSTKNEPAYSTNMEEEKVREMFAISRLFKLDDPFKNNLNEYEGLGVNIFKSCDNKDSAILSKKNSPSVYNVRSLNNSYHCSPKPFEPYIPLEGFIAVKPYLKDDMENYSSIPVSEVWDDDFYF